MAHIKTFKDLRVWQKAMDLAMRVFELTKSFPPEERYSLTDQFRLRRGRLPQTSRKPGANADIRRPSSPS